jgi:type II secretory pathway component PulF
MVGAARAGSTPSFSASEGRVMSELQEQVDTKGTLTPEETGQLTEQIAGLAKLGLPLGPGLRALGSELPRGPLRDSLFDLSESLSQGNALDKAMEEQGDRIPPHLRGLVLGGMRSGRLGDILGRFSGYMSIGTELKRKLWLSLAYPLISIIAAITLFVFVNAVLVAQFEAIFRDFGIPLPRLTIGMILISHFFREGWPALLIVGVAIAVLWVVLRVMLKAPDRRSLAARIPVVGSVWRYTSWAEFCHLLALLLESRLTLPEALRLAGEGVQNSDLDRACRVIASDVERGETLAQAMAIRPELPTGLARLLRWATKQNAIAEILHMAGEIFEARAKGQAMFAGTVMAVLSVVIVLWGVCSVFGGLMLPLITLISKLSG